LGYWRAFLTAPLTRRESEAMGVRSEKSAGGLMVGLWNVSPSKGLGLQFCFSFQTPIRASEVNRSERQFDLFVSVKRNVDAVQSKGRAPA
jgi:hypothetical protein